MRKLLTIAALLVSSSAFGRDSTWLLCNSESLVVSVHEHRAGEGRETSFTLIFGVHDLRGALKDADSGRIKLKGVGEPQTEFTGTMGVNFETSKLSISGNLKLDGEGNDIKTTMPCREMTGEL